MHDTFITSQFKEDFEGRLNSLSKGKLLVLQLSEWNRRSGPESYQPIIWPGLNESGNNMPGSQKLMMGTGRNDMICSLFISVGFATECSSWAQGRTRAAAQIAPQECVFHRDMEPQK